MQAPATVIIKLTARCNLKCNYCYMFEHADRSFLSKSAVMPMALFKKTIDLLGQSAQLWKWEKLKLTLHGGEPLLAGKAYFNEALDYAHQTLRPITALKISLQTNGVLIDQEWVDLLSHYGVAVGISLDGDKESNDLHRLDHKGRSSYSQTTRGIELCLKSSQQGNLNFGGLLAVINPLADGQKVFQHFVDDLGVQWIDFLLPDGHHEDLGDYHRLPPLSYARFLTEVFDTWWKREDASIHVRCLESIIDLILGGHTTSESLGGGMAHLLVVETDGSLEPLDVLRLTGDGFTRQGLFVGESSLTDFFSSPLMKRLKEEGEKTPFACQNCRYKDICGGGYLPHRYSKSNGFNNPSIYCADLKVLIEHIRKRILENLQTERRVA